MEPQTTVTEVTVVLVATDGEWTRRRVGGERGARKLGKTCASPCTTSAKPAIRSGCATTTRVRASSEAGRERTATAPEPPCAFLTAGLP